MPELISVASRSPLAVRIRAPIENTDKPGLEPERFPIIINGASHPGARNGVMVTHGVDAAIFHAWLEEQSRAETPLSELIFEVPADYESDSAMSFGFEPGLARLAANAENAEAAAQGSTVTHAAPVSASEMAATSDTPPDDTPRGDPDIVPQARSQTPATAMVDPAVDASKGTSPAGGKAAPADKTADKAADKAADKSDKA